MRNKSRIKTNELSLINGLRDWKDHSTNGWKNMKLIMKDSKTWKSQPQNFTKYINSLKDYGIIEERNIEYFDKRKRIHFKNEWRLIQNLKSYYIIQKLISLYQNEILLKQMINVTNVNDIPRKLCDKYGRVNSYTNKYDEIIRKKYNIKNILENKEKNFIIKKLICINDLIKLYRKEDSQYIKKEIEKIREEMKK